MSKRAPRKASEPPKEPSFGLKWKDVDDYFYVMDSPEIKGSAKIASFDMDSTLVEPKSGAKFPTGRNDWKWWDDRVIPKLKELYEDGFKIIIFTNQGGIEKNKTNKSDITGKITDLAEELGFPMQAFIAGAEDHYRKPHTTMWDYMVENLNGGIKPDLKVSFFCGDAAGRQAGWKAGKKKDFSCGDRHFGTNIGCLFYTPEELFLEEKAVDFEWGGINPKTLVEKSKGKVFDTKGLTSSSQELIIMVGRQASGKSTITKRYLVPAGYVQVNRDTLKTPAKCKKAVQDAFAEGVSVVVDNTNPSKETRAEYIKIAQEKGIPVRCFWMQTDQDTANHLNYVRVRETGGEVRRIPDVAFRTFNKGFQEPTLGEGFTEVRKIDFVCDLRDDEKFTRQFLGWTPEGI